MLPRRAHDVACTIRAQGAPTTKDRIKRLAPSAFGWLMVPMALLDFLCLQIALSLGYWVWVAYPWHGNYQSFQEYALVLVILPSLGIVVFHTVGLYKTDFGTGIDEQSLIFKAIWIVYLGTFMISFFYRSVAFSRLAILYSIVFAITLVSLERFAGRRFMEWLRQRGFAVRKAAIYGAGYHGQRLANWIGQSPKVGIQVVGFVDDDLDKLFKRPEGLPVLGGFEDLRKIIREKNISTLFVTHRLVDEKSMLEIFQMCREIGVQCWIIPRLFQLHLEKSAMANIGGIPFVGFRDEFRLTSYLLVKSVLDFVLALLFLPFVLPVAAVIAVVIRVTSSGPVLFKQIRIGQRGERFWMMKFRTLSKDAPSESPSPELQRGSGSAVAPFASFLRRTGLDELPQIFNVLRGDMSFVGPRPEMSFLVEKYSLLERERLLVKPGITGIWQLSDDRKKKLIHESIDHDLYYVEHLSFNLDLAIMMKTALVLLRRIKGGRTHEAAARGVSANVA